MKDDSDKAEATPTVIYTDGLCLHPQGPGGWATVIHKMHGNTELEKLVISGHVDPTTNVKMEMIVVVKALSRPQRDEKAPIIVRSDNQMISLGMHEWLPGWIAKGCRKAGGKPVLNRDLWEDLQRLSEGLNITWEWVKGHSGDPMNAEVDRLASAAVALPSENFFLISPPIRCTLATHLNSNQCGLQIYFDWGSPCADLFP